MSGTHKRRAYIHYLTGTVGPTSAALLAFPRPITSPGGPRADRLVQWELPPVGMVLVVRVAGIMPVCGDEHRQAGWGEPSESKGAYRPKPNPETGARLRVRRNVRMDAPASASAFSVGRPRIGVFHVSVLSNSA